MTEPTGWRLDRTINISTLGMIAAAVLAVSAWVNTVNQRLDAVAQLIVDQRKNTEQFAAVDRRLSVIEQNSTVNRRILESNK
jgi:F0F1-type ATP synthase assembly protein I